MASGWVKSLQCKSRAFDDVYHPTAKKLLPSSSCRSRSSQSIKDVIETTTKKKHQHKNPRKSKPATKSESGTSLTVRARHSERCTARNTDHATYPALTELPEGHPSRNVVEIIFHTSWGPKAFAGRIEIIFKVQHGSMAVARFEEYREMVKRRSGSRIGSGHTSEENARCVADGNEVMRFYCLGPIAGRGTCGEGYSAWCFPGRKGSAICTFSGSSGAHESAGGGRGRRAMLVCRVIAGRVSKQIGHDSISGENGELLLFDSRAVLPCFLIIYML